MKIIIIIFFTGSFLLTLSLLTADVREKGGDDFLMINDNIQNQELRAELEMLREEFNLERIQIQEHYKEQMVALKNARKEEIKTIKKAFADRREVLMKKYVGKMQKKPQMQPPKPVKNAPGKMKSPKEKRKVRKQ